MLGCLCIGKFVRELVLFWRDILTRGRGVGLAWIVFWLGLAWIVFGLAWLGLDRFWLGLVGSLLVGLGWIVFGLTEGWRKTNSKIFFARGAPDPILTQL